MKEYKYQLNTKGWRLDERFYIIAADPKREGMYKATEVQIKDGKERKFIGMYGKSNQAEIQRLIKTL
tara:strand:- start:507 stop:707 length:201 start_codon:yes stop_codon:yes gene_type:complete